MPLRIPIGTVNGGTTLFMPGYSPRAEAMAVKVVSVFPSNVELGLPTISALVVLSDGRTARLSRSWTARPSRPSARERPRVWAPISWRVRMHPWPPSSGRAHRPGCSCSAWRTCGSCLECACSILTRKRAEAFAAEMSPLVGLTVRVAGSGDEAVDGADVVACATTSRTPVFSGARLAPGTHVNGAGSFTPQMQEVDEQTVLRAAKIVVDSREAVLAEAGDLLVPMGKGLIDASAVYAEIGEIAAGIKPGRETAEEITFFKHVGIALLDVVTAKLAYERALAKNLGVEIDL